MRIVITTAGQTDENLYYVTSNYLGSICGLLDEAGSMQQEYSYDAWGRRRNPATWQNYTQTQLTTYYSSLITDRGYTGHEMLDLFGLINMNGRMYDPLVGRFLSADPMIQSAGGSQGYNAYSYALCTIQDKSLILIPILVKHRISTLYFKAGHSAGF